MPAMPLSPPGLVSFSVTAAAAVNCFCCTRSLGKQKKPRCTEEWGRMKRMGGRRRRGMTKVKLLFIAAVTGLVML